MDDNKEPKEENPKGFIPAILTAQEIAVPIMAFIATVTLIIKIVRKVKK